MQHFKFVNWRIGKLVVSFFWCYEQVIQLCHEFKSDRQFMIVFLSLNLIFGGKLNKIRLYKVHANYKNVSEDKKSELRAVHTLFFKVTNTFMFGSFHLGIFVFLYFGHFSCVIFFTMCSVCLFFLPVLPCKINKRLLYFRE